MSEMKNIAPEEKVLVLRRGEDAKIENQSAARFFRFSVMFLTIETA